MEYMDEHHLFFEYYLKALMDSPEGGQLRKSLENTIADEERCLNEFKKMISQDRSTIPSNTGLTRLVSGIFESSPINTMKRIFFPIIWVGHTVQSNI